MTSNSRSDLAALLLAAIAGLVVFGSGWLLRPDPLPGNWQVQWAGAREGMDTFGGTVLVTAAGRNIMRPGAAAATGTASEILRRGGLLAIGAIAGEATERPAPLVTLFGPDGQEAMMVAVHGDDVLFRQRTRASSFKLHTPLMRAQGALAVVAPGDTLRMLTLAQGEDRCIQVQDQPFCGLGLTPGAGWLLLAGDDHGGRQPMPAVNAAWLALLLLPAGLMARPRVAAAILVAAVWYLVIRLPVDTVLQPAPATEAVAAAVGVLAGALLRWRNTRPQADAAHAVPAGG